MKCYCEISLFRLDSQRTADMFNIFNTSGDGSMSLQEFKECYDSWIEKVISPTRPLTLDVSFYEDCEAKVCSCYCGRAE